jgi:hypothetical protein
MLYQSSEHSTRHSRYNPTDTDLPRQDGHDQSDRSYERQDMDPLSCFVDWVSSVPLLLLPPKFSDR